MFIFSLEIFLLLYFIIKQKIGDKYNLFVPSTENLKTEPALFFFNIINSCSSI